MFEQRERIFLSEVVIASEASQIRAQKIIKKTYRHRAGPELEVGETVFLRGRFSEVRDLHLNWGNVDVQE